MKRVGDALIESSFYVTLVVILCVMSWVAYIAVITTPITTVLIFVLVFGYFGITDSKSQVGVK